VKSTGAPRRRARPRATGLAERDRGRSLQRRFDTAVLVGPASLIGAPMCCSAPAWVETRSRPDCG
jgi:hypothetical protein